MLNLVKHGIWALSLTACVYLAATHNWSPLQIKFLYERQFAQQNAPAAPMNVEQGASQYLATAREAATLQIAQPNLTSAPQVNTADLASITDPAIAEKVLGALATLEGINGYADQTPAKKVIFAFFDPRCPYCGEAFKVMNGKLPIKWIPVVVLGNAQEGTSMAASLLSAQNRLQAMQDLNSGQLSQNTENLSETILAALKTNLEHYAAIVSAAPNLQKGVPMFFIPDTKGGIAIKVGFEAGDEAKISALFKGP